MIIETKFSPRSGRGPIVPRDAAGLSYYQSPVVEPRYNEQSFMETKSSIRVHIHRTLGRFLLARFVLSQRSYRVSHLAGFLQNAANK